MAMTKKDFELIAGALKSSCPLSGNGHAQWMNDVSLIAKALENNCGFDSKGNRRFKLDRFLNACGVL